MQSGACSLTTQRPDKYPTRVNDGAYQEDRNASGDGLVALLPPAQLLRVHISADDAVYGLSGAFSEEERIVAPRKSAMGGACLLASTIQVQVAGPASNDGVMFADAAAGRMDLRPALRNCIPLLHPHFCPIPSTWLACINRTMRLSGMCCVDIPLHSIPLINFACLRSLLLVSNIFCLRHTATKTAIPATRRANLI